jgi:hypothetical protein
MCFTYVDKNLFDFFWSEMEFLKNRSLLVRGRPAAGLRVPRFRGVVVAVPKAWGQCYDFVNVALHENGRNNVFDKTKKLLFKKISIFLSKIV